MLLMFGVGLHFSLDDLLAVRRVVVPGAVVQMCMSAGLGIAVALFWGWTPGATVVMGLALSIASTVVVLRALEAGRALQSINGRIAIGWLIVEDLVMVLVLVGYGRVGCRIAQALSERGIPYVVVEQNRDRVKELREKDIAAVSGDAAHPIVLIQAHIAKASMLVIATPDTFDVRKRVEIARTLNPTIETVLRTHNEDEAKLLENDNLGKVFVGEHELALGMTQHILERMGVQISDRYRAPK